MARALSCRAVIDRRSPVRGGPASRAAARLARRRRDRGRSPARHRRARFARGAGRTAGVVVARTAVARAARGSGTKLAWGRVACRRSIWSSAPRRLDRVLAHAHGDLTATVQAGATVAGTNRQLARHGQWLPLHTSFEEATVGGTVATNESGPLRQRYGTPRDLLIGVRLATTDGRLVKAGGNVVKNVAGYDLGKLMSGSFGSLAAIVSATFKLAPVPAASATLVARVSATLAAMARAVCGRSASSQLEPAAFDCTRRRVRCAIESAIALSAAGAVRVDHGGDRRAARRRAAAPDRRRSSAALLNGAAKADALARADAALGGGRRRHPGELAAGQPAPDGAVALTIGRRDRRSIRSSSLGRAGVGAGLLRIDGDAPTTVARDRAAARARRTWSGTSSCCGPTPRSRIKPMSGARPATRPRCSGPSSGHSIRPAF